MRIISLFIENIKKIRAASITPSSSTIPIVGKNAAGKSSILDSIIMGLCGGRTIPEVPITTGQHKGGIEIDLGDFKVIRSFTPKGAYLKIEPTSATNGKSPQEFLNEIVGKIAFDPLEFIRKTPKDQRKDLLAASNVDLTDLERKEKALFDERTIKGRELKTAKAKLDGLRHYDGITDTEEVPLADLAKKLTEAQQFNISIVERQRKNSELAVAGRALKQQISELQDKLVKMRNQYDDENAALSLIERIDTGLIDQEIAEIDSRNLMIRANKEYDTRKQETEKISTEYNDIELDLLAVRDRKNTQINSIKLPAGLSITDDGLLYNNLPISQCSAGEQLKIGVMMAKAFNPTLKVIIVRDGSLLDKDNMQAIEDLLSAEGYQLWIERVGDKDGYDGMGVLIEDGEVVLSAFADGKGGSKTRKRAKGNKVVPAIENSSIDW